MEREGRLIVAVEIGPVHGNQDRLALPHHVRHPPGEAVPDVDALVAEQAVDLLDRMLGGKPARLRQRLADDRDRERGACHHPQRRTGQRGHPLGMQVMLVNRLDERPNVVQTRAKPTIHFPHGLPRVRYQSTYRRREHRIHTIFRL